MSKVKAVPDGYTTITPMFNIRGAARAIELYKKAFGAEELMREPGPGNTIMHAELMIGNARIMLSEAAEVPTSGGNMHLYVENADLWWKRAVDAGCTVVLPMADMFWGDRYGVLMDPFGNRWAIAQHTEDVSRAELKARMPAAIKAMEGGKPPLRP